MSFLLCVLLCVATHAQDLFEFIDLSWQPPQHVYATAADLPNPLIYLPAPTDTASAAFASDFFKWQWGKKIRVNANGNTSTRGTYANNDSKYGLDRWCSILTSIFRFSVTSAKTPNIVYFVYQVGETGSVSTQYAKLQYMRRRPFDQMNEDVWAKYDVRENLLQSGSFPSSHAAFGWAVALSMAEIVPELQDTLLARAYYYGENRAVVGAHWMSDVEAGFLTASAAVAHLHTLDSYKNGFNLAKEEYYLKRTTEPNNDVGFPNGRRVQLYNKVDTASEYYFSDLQGYWQAKAERRGTRIDDVILDADDSENALLEMFGNIMGVKLVVSMNPYTVWLVHTAREAFIQSAQEMGSSGAFRKRPYVQLGEPTLIPSEEEYYANTTSYPSTKAMLGWGLALLLSEVAPDCNEALLKRGYDYGYSRVIAGYNYPSDVMAGRIQAAAVLARLHYDEDFKELISLAQEEYINQNRLVTVVKDIKAPVESQADSWFTTTGIRLRERPTAPGIYIHNGNKVVVLAN